MKKTLLLLSLLLLGTMAFGQCLPPIVNGQPVMIGPGSAPDYFGCGNYASSPLPKRSCSYADPITFPSGKACYGDLECANEIDPANPTVVSLCSGAIEANTGIKKFVDSLPNLGPGGANNLGNYIPIATPDTTTYPGSDYYEIELIEYTQQMHSNLPATKLRGYRQTNNGTDASGNNSVPPDPNPHYLGPTILSMKDRPVRILFRNQLPVGSGGNLFVPVDTTVMGAGMGPDMGGMLPPDGGSVNDGARNPMCNMDPKPAGCFTENRATLHLHGGMTPWISDGTPHQWITPGNEPAAYPDSTIQPRRNEGVSVVNVPDMPDPGPGAQTFFYTNQQSARLMFYHDHAWGITRLNVYAGEAAGYVLTDATEQALMTTGALAGLSNPIPYGIPLIIQDKTFIPTPDQLATEDPTWDSTKWGGLGSLWVPHVYMPAQDPDDPSGMSAFGRWMYGPWFWPPASPMYPPIANPYFDPLCDADVAGWCQPPLIPGTPNQSVGMEHFNDTPLINGTAYPTLTLPAGEYRFRILNAANDRFWNLQWYVADGTGTEVALNAAELAAAQLDPNIFPTPDTAVSPAGPAWIQIGTEGGFLPAPVVVPNQVTTWIIDPTRFDVGNVDKHALLLAPAERADVLVDFTPFAGKTLILYNDAPAAFPARVGTYDYYTGAPDQTDAGGAPSPQPGFGPNTRTIMQVVVTGGAGSATPNWVNPARLASLQTAWAHHLDANGQPAGVFESSQDPIIVGQAAYNSAYGTSFRAAAPRNGVARIADFSMTFNTLLTGNDSANTLTIPFQPKAIHDEMNSAAFDEYGRMTANLGFEAPNPGPVNQNIVLYPYINPPIRMTDGFIAHDDINGVELAQGSLKVTPIASASDGTEIWKFTHNGVDTHPIHFHLFNVQLLNRVAWDNRVIMPDANELGWKDTVRMSPLSDTIVALRPIVPKIPFGVPDSRRPINPAMPLGNDHGYANLDPNGDPLVTPITNQITDFGWEYVFHCHILGHEEMDMMRPLIANVSRALPAAPSVSYTLNGGVALTWTDGTPVDYANPTTFGDPANEIGFRVERADASNTYSMIGTTLANQVTFTDAGADPTQPYSYRVTAFNAAGNSVSAPVVIQATPVITWATPAPIAYGTALSDVQLNATASVAGTFVYTPAAGTVLSVGTQTLSVLFTPTDTVLYTTATATVTLVVGQSTPTITWATPAPILYGTALSDVQLNATASVPGTFAYTPASGTVLNAGSQTLSVTFTPTDTVNYTTASATVTLVVNQATSATTITAHTPNPSNTNQAVAVSFSVAPQVAGTPTGNVTVTANTGETCIGALNAGAGTCSVTFAIAGPRTLTATYPGDINFLGSTSPGVSHNVNALGPFVTPTAFNFSNQIVFTFSAPTTVILTNPAGGSRLTGITISFAGPNAAEFTRLGGGAGNCGTTLAVNASCNIRVRFRPAAAGARSATMNVNANGFGVPLSVALSGTGAQANATATPASINFGSVIRGQVSAPQAVTVTNTGSAPLVFRATNAFVFSGGQSAHFSFPAGSTCLSGGTLAPGANCTVMVAFSPAAGTARNLKSTTLNIRDNAPNSPQQVALTGTAQ